MTVYAYVVDGKVDSVYDKLPDNWKNISNFFALEGEDKYLESLGWYKIQRQECSVFMMWKDPTYRFIDGKVIETRELYNAS